jgi:hypothetical protein
LIELFNDRNFSFLKGNSWQKNFPESYLIESILSLRFFTTILFANDNITNDIPVINDSKPSKVLMAIAPVPIFAIIIIAATTHIEPAITITHPVELYFLRDQPVFKRNRPDNRHHKPKTTVRVFIVANKLNRKNNPKPKVIMAHRSEKFSLSGLLPANHARIPTSPAASTITPNQNEIPASTPAGLLKM